MLTLIGAVAMVVFCGLCLGIAVGNVITRAVDLLTGHDDD
jgi:hypothetical protein